MSGVTPDQKQFFLKLISIFHYVVGAITGLFALFPILHFAMGIFFMTAPMWCEGKDCDEVFVFPVVGGLMSLVAGTFILLGLTLAVFIVINGIRIAQRRNHTFCLVVAAVECISIPFGTVLGIFTILLLIQEDVRALFDAAEGAKTDTVESAADKEGVVEDS